MLTVIVAARNDNYGGDFRERFYRSVEHNAALLTSAKIQFEYLLAEWNPLADQPLLSEEFIQRIPQGRAIVIPHEVHTLYGLNKAMPFYEMAAKNAALRRADGQEVLITNADILFSEEIIHFLANASLHPRTLYRAHRIDVDPALSWSEMQAPGNQLASGEGLFPPPYYLGAAGDFCLADRSLFHALRGYNERIRFSTRAKDWHFFLSAAAQGIQIEFIGAIYHLDHSAGFRNTPASQRQSPTAHFGQWWDIEFGLPFRNDDDWGFSQLNSLQFQMNPRIQVLESQSYEIPPDRDLADRELQDLLTYPCDKIDLCSALLLHSLYAAYINKRRLICRLETLRSCIVLSGLLQVAESFAIEVLCNSVIPSFPGFTVPEFRKEPQTLSALDFIFQEFEGTYSLIEAGSQKSIEALPRKNQFGNPYYNPLLVKRLLLAFLRMRKQEVQKIGIFGAGSHTEDLLAWGVPDDFEIVALLQSNGQIEDKFGKPVLPIHALTLLNVDAVLLSSTAFEPDMQAAALEFGAARVIPLYLDWPTSFLQPSET